MQWRWVLHTHKEPAMLPPCLMQVGSAVSLLLRPNKTGCKAEFIALSGTFSFGSNPHQYICNISNALLKMGLFWRPDMFIALANHPFLFNLVLDRNKYIQWDLHMGRQAHIFRLACLGLHLYCNHCCSYRWCQAPCAGYHQLLATWPQQCRAPHRLKLPARLGKN